jgi:putative peptidoglycan lipid II flippase
MAQSTLMPRPTAARIARSAALVIGLLAFAKLFSLAENWIALNRFGISSAWDTYAAANKIPEQVFNLIAGGALAYAFIPIFGTFLTHDDREGAWRLASNVLNTVFLAALILSVIIFFAAPWLIANVVAPGFNSPYIDLSRPLDSSVIPAAFHPDRVVQTASLMRILLLSLLLFSISGLCTGILHTNQRFLLPALAPIMYDAGNVFGVLILARYFGIYGAAIGAVIGAGLHLGIQIPGLIRLRATWLPILDWHDSALRQVIVLMIPRAAGLALVQANMLVATNIASGLGAGSVAAFSRGWSLMQFPETLIGTAMGIVIFPALAVLSSSGDLRGKRDAMSGALRFILIASIPAAVAVAIAGRPLVGVLEGGAFDAEGADRVFRVLQFFALGIVTQSAVEIVARAFYADKDTITPLWVALITAAVNLALALAFTDIFRVAGLALANSLAVGVELLTLIAILRRRWQGINESALIAAAVKAVLAAAAMGVVMFGVSAFLDTLPLGTGRIISLVRAGVELAVGGAVYVAVALLLGVNEIRDLPRLILQRRSAAAVAPAEAPGD